MGILRHKAWEMGWNKQSTSSWECRQNLLRRTVCLGCCPCHMGSTRLDISRGLLDACLPQPVIILHWTCASLREGQRPSSQSMMAQAWYMPPHLSPGAMTGNICHSFCFVMGSRTFLPHIVTLLPTRKGIQMRHNEGKSPVSRSLTLIMS